MNFQIFLAVGILIFPNSGCNASSDDVCTFDNSIRSEAIGPVQLGSSLNDLRKKYDIAEARLPYSDISGYEVTFCNDKASVIVEADVEGVVISLSTTSPIFQTASGGKVGMSLNQLQQLHPEGVISTGVEESGWVALLLDEVSGFFAFSVDGVEFSCLKDNRSCPPEFYERPAIRYWTR